MAALKSVTAGLGSEKDQAEGDLGVDVAKSSAALQAAVGALWTAEKFQSEAPQRRAPGHRGARAALTGGDGGSTGSGRGRCAHHCRRGSYFEAATFRIRGKKIEAPASLDFHACVLGYLDFLSCPSGNHFLLLRRLIFAPLSRFVERDVCSLFFCGTE